MASRLPLLGELRASRGARAARPATLALSGDVCVVGYEDGAVAAWRCRIERAASFKGAPVASSNFARGMVCWW